MKQHITTRLIIRKLLLLMTLIFTIVAFSFIACNKDIVKGKKINSIEITRQSDKKILTLLDKDIITEFIKALNNSKEITNKKIDIRSPDYSVKIYFVDKSSQEYMLWVNNYDNQQGVLMNENKLWFISGKSNAIIKEILTKEGITKEGIN